MTAADFFEVSLLVTAAALLLERFAGYPDGLVRAVGHPVIWIGRLIGWCDRHLNREGWTAGRRKLAGLATLLLVLLLTGGIALALTLLLRSLPFGWVAEAVLASSLISL